MADPRPIPAIGGLAGMEDPVAAERLGKALGPRARILTAPPSTAGGPTVPVAVIGDSCWLDGEPLDDAAGWQSALQAGRLSHVTGAFAVAWLGSDGTLHLARDAIGERTLYYAAVGGGLVFASTLRGLLGSGLVPRRLDLRAVVAYLAYGYVPGRETPVAGVHEVLPGEHLTYRRGTLTRARHFTLPAEDLRDEPDEEALRQALRARLEGAVGRRLPASEPVGAFLSGGIDSSLVVALARRLHDKPVLAYSVSFGPDYPNELAWSSLVASHCAAAHRVVELGPDLVLRHLDEVVAALGKPIGDPLTVPNALLFREAAAEVGVVLNGEGGDPCFGGPKNVPMLLAELLGDGADLDDAGSGARARSYLRAHQKCYDELEALLTPEALETVRARPLEGDLEPWFADRRWPRFVTRLMAMNVALKGAHHILPKVESLSAPFGVLARSPLFDRDLVELAFRIPPRLKLRGGVEKYLLKEAVRDLLPPAVLGRPKSGMLVPVEGWLARAGAPLGEAARERLLDGLPRWGIVRREFLERLVGGRLPGLRPRRGVKLWLLVTLEAWLRGVLAAPTA